MNTMIQDFPQTTSVHQLQKEYRKLINKAKREKAPLYILKNNKLEGVFIDSKLWNQIAQVWEEADLDESVRIARKERKEGNLKELTSLKDLKPQ